MICESVDRVLRRDAGRAGIDMSPRAYKQRNTAERCINRLKQRCGLATRTDRLVIAYQAALHLAGILIWTRR
ncbi:hypothetical protein GCM10009801_27420 [Streptomyces albiaxialis]|uniref:Transposase DDE domain-containing protein n=1 Tax=Streptomyces albiaxialis TaxID=329523 RepID=A0ABN2VVG0_9ACTN